MIQNKLNPKIGKDVTGKQISHSDIVEETHKGETFYGQVMSFSQLKKMTWLDITATVEGWYIVDMNNYRHWSLIDPLDERTQYKIVGHV